MARTESDQNRIREYLLGRLTNDEQQRMEERLMVEDDLFEELEISKGELIEEYRAGELNLNERERLEQTYLSSNDGRERHAFVLAIDRLALRNVPQPQSIFERLLHILKTQPWVTATAVAATAVIIVGAVLLFRPRPLTSYSVVLAHTLPTRSTSTDGPLPTGITLPPHTGELKAELELPKPFPQGTHFEVQLDNRSEEKRPVKVVAQNEKVVTVTIPTSELPRGEYALKLTAVMSDGTRKDIPGAYRFDIR